MIKIALVGDVLMTRPLPQNGYDGLQEVADLIHEHEVKLANLEMTVHRKEGYPSAFPGGTWAMADPVCLKGIKQFGFNLLNTANNHAMDYSHIKTRLGGKDHKLYQLTIFANPIIAFLWYTKKYTEKFIRV